MNLVPRSNWVPFTVSSKYNRPFCLITIILTCLSRFCVSWCWIITSAPKGRFEISRECQLHLAIDSFLPLELLFRLRDWKVSELESVRMLFSSKLESVRIGKCQNWKVSELESVRIGKCQNWKVSELESVRIFRFFKYGARCRRQLFGNGITKQLAKNSFQRQLKTCPSAKKNQLVNPSPPLKSNSLPHW